MRLAPAGETVAPHLVDHTSSRGRSDGRTADTQHSSPRLAAAEDHSPTIIFRQRGSSQGGPLAVASLAAVSARAASPGERSLRAFGPSRLDPWVSPPTCLELPCSQVTSASVFSSGRLVAHRYSLHTVQRICNSGTSRRSGHPDETKFRQSPHRTGTQTAIRRRWSASPRPVGSPARAAPVDRAPESQRRRVVQPPIAQNSRLRLSRPRRRRRDQSR